MEKKINIFRNILSVCGCFIFAYYMNFNAPIMWGGYNGSGSRYCNKQNWGM